MTISYNTLSTFSGSPQSSCIDTVNDAVYIVETSTNTFRRYSLSTGAQIGTSTAVLPSNINVSMLTSASAIALTANASADIIEVATGYKVTYNFGTSLNTLNGLSNNVQAIAYDPVNSVVMFVTNSKAIGRITAVAGVPVFATINIPNMALTNSFNTITFKSNGRFLVGSSYGHIIEIDSSGNVYDQLIVNYPNGTNIAVSTSSGVFSGPSIRSMEYSDNNILVVNTYEGIFTFDYTTKTFLQNLSTCCNSSLTYVLSNAASGTMLACQKIFTTGVYPMVVEMDVSIMPYGQVRSRFFAQNGGTATTVVQLGINPNTGHGVYVMNSNSGTCSMFFLTITPRSSTTRTVTVQPNGTDVKFRLMAIDDTGGVGSRKIVFDSYCQSPYTYRLPTGKSIIELISYCPSSQVQWQNGTSQQWQMGRFTT